MSPTEVLPLLVLVVLLMSVSGVEPDQMRIVFDGEHAAVDVDDALVVAGGDVRVPEGRTATGTLYVIGGTATVSGTLDGDATVLAGNLTLPDGGVVTGELRTISGNVTVAPGASVGRRSSFDVAPQSRSRAAAASWLLVRVLVVALAAGLVARRAPVLLRNVGDAITAHGLVSGVVGAIAGSSMLVLFVYMAFTLILLPLSIVGLLVEVLLVVYAYLAYGYLVGRRLPLERVDLATGLGAGAFALGLELLGRVPLLGAAVQFVVIVVGLGAVLITYLGLREFEPARIPG